MNYQHKSGAVISQMSFDHLHPDLQAKFSSVEEDQELVSHKINIHGSGLDPVVEDAEAIDLLGDGIEIEHKPKKKK